MPKLVAFIFTFFLFNTSPSHCQSKIHNARIVSSETSEGIAFCSISFNNRQIGTSSDINGQFSISIPASVTDSTYISISHVAYNPIKIRISELSDTIVLDLSTVILDEVKVSSTSKCEKILKQAFINMEANYSKDPTLLDFHHIETISSDSSAGRYVEMTGQLIDPQFSIKRKRTKSNSYTVHIEESRSSINQEKEFKIGNGILHNTDQNYIKYSASFLSSPLNAHYDYNYKGIENYKGFEVYKIVFAPKPNTNLPLPTGFIYITTEHFAIVALKTHISENAQFFPPTQSQITKTQVTKMDTFVDYRFENGVWLMNYIEKSEFFEFSSEGQIKPKNIHLKLHLYINNANSSNSNSKDFLSKTDNIYNSQYEYHDEYWADSTLNSQYQHILNEYIKQRNITLDELNNEFKIPKVIE